MRFTLSHHGIHQRLLFNFQGCYFMCKSDLVSYQLFAPVDLAYNCKP